MLFLLGIIYTKFCGRLHEDKRWKSNTKYIWEEIEHIIRRIIKMNQGVSLILKHDSFFCYRKNDNICFDQRNKLSKYMSNFESCDFLLLSSDRMMNPKLNLRIISKLSHNTLHFKACKLLILN